MTDLLSVIGNIEKDFKKINPDIVYNPNAKVEFLTSGDLGFDLMSGGGFPKKRLTEMFGMEHSGKTSMCLASLAHNQKMGGIGVLVDAEGAWDPDYAKNVFGLDVDAGNFAVLAPDNIEECDLLLERMAALDGIDLIVFDSIDAMKPKSLIEGALEKEKRVGAHAQAIARFIPKLRKFAKKFNCAVVLINQMRSIIATNAYVETLTTGAGFKANENFTTTGGMAPRYYASLRVKLEYGGTIKATDHENVITGEVDEKEKFGHVIRMINVKNKCSTPFLKVDSHFIFPSAQNRGGWDEFLTIQNILKKRGYMGQAATKFWYKGLNIPEWSNTGSKVASQKMFSEDEDLMADARALVVHLIEESKKYKGLVSEEDINVMDLSSGEEEVVNLGASLLEGDECSFDQDLNDCEEFDEGVQEDFEEETIISDNPFA